MVSEKNTTGSLSTKSVDHRIKNSPVRKTESQLGLMLETFLITVAARRDE